MYLIVIGLIVGLVIGGFIQIDIPPEYTRYTAVAIVGILDSLFGAIRASAEKKYDTIIFITGLGFNMAIAVLITFFGDKLNLDLYLAILVAFMVRIFANIGIIKTTALSGIQNWIHKQP
ncbi:MAG: small basic family protein [Patescibacteria group bacterium]